MSSDSSNPTTWNPYAYTAGDPVNAIDPHGTDLFLIAAPSAQDCNSDPSQAGCNDPCQPNPYMDGLIDAPMPECYDNITPTIPGIGPQTQSTKPTCQDALTSAIDTFLSGRGSPLANYASTLVAVGQKDNIDPTLFAAIAVAENGSATNNPFALGPNGSNTYPDLDAAIAAVGTQLDKYIYTWGEGTVSDLWSGKKWEVDPKKKWITTQYPAYCVGTTPGAAALCQNTGNTISGFMQKIGAQAGVGGNPNNLAFPCKD